MKNLHRFAVKYNEIYKYLTIHQKINWKHYLSNDVILTYPLSSYNNYVLVKRKNKRNQLQTSR